MSRFLDPNSIIIRDRYREDMGDLERLASDIKEVGQLQPILVQPSDEGLLLLAGHRRLEACKLLGRKVWVSLTTDADIASTSDFERKRIEAMENLSRKNFAPVEEARILADLHELMQSVYGEAQRGRPAEDEAKGWGLQDTAQLVGYRSKHPVRDALLVAKAAATGTMPELAEARTINEASNLVRMKLKREAQEELIRRQAARQVIEGNGNEPRDLEKHFGDMILQGNCLDLMKKLPDAFVDYLITDPPYGIGLDKHREGRNITRIGLDQYKDSTEEPLPNFKEISNQIGRICKPDSFIIIFCGVQWFHSIHQEMEAMGFDCYNKPVIWVKTYPNGTPVSGTVSKQMKHPGSSYEAAVFGVRGNVELAKSGWSDVILHPVVNPGEKIHIAQKPIGLWQTLLEKIHHPGTTATMLDPFCGSASSLAAAQRFPGIKAIGMELDPKFRQRAISFLIEDYLKRKNMTSEGEAPGDLEDL